MISNRSHSPTDARDAYRTGMALLQQKRQQLFPNSRSIASLTGQEQIIGDAEANKMLNEERRKPWNLI